MYKRVLLLSALLLIGTSSTTVFAANEECTAFTSENVEVFSDGTNMGIQDSVSESEGIEPYWLFAKKYECTGDEVCIRTQPNTSSAIVGYLYKGDTVNVYAIDNGWARIKDSNGNSRYVYALYLREA